jgi:hypothetical protein
VLMIGGQFFLRSTAHPLQHRKVVWLLSFWEWFVKCHVNPACSHNFLTVFCRLWKLPLERLHTRRIFRVSEVGDFPLAGLSIF